MPQRGSQNSVPIGLVARRSALATRVRRALKGSGLALAFEVSPEEAQGDFPLERAAILVVVGPFDSEESGLLPGLRSRFPEGRIVACSDPVESPTIRWAMELGVDGLIWSDRLDECLEPTVRAVHADQVVIPRDILPRSQPRDLTNREKQALSMVIMGLTNLEIAQKLFISENTVKSHLNTAYKKLGVHSRAEAQRLITDPGKGLGTGILAITAPGLSRGRPPKTGRR